MATVTTTGGAQFGAIPLDTLMVDKDAVVEIVSGSASGVVDTVSGMISSAISTVWKAGGSKAATDLTSALLVAANEGYVYNLTTDATTTSDWVEGANKTILAGTDVAVINTAASGQTAVYKFNALAPRDASVVKSIAIVSPGGDVLYPTSGEIEFPAASSYTCGLMTIEEYEKLSGIAAGAEVNQNAFSKIAVSGVTGTGDANSKTDTLTLVPGNNVTMSRSGKSVTINATVPSGVVTGVVTDSGTASADSSGNVEIYGGNGVSVFVSGSAVLVDGSSISGVASGAASGVTALSGVVSGLKNFSKVTVLNSGGTTVTNGELTPGSKADDTLKLQAGSNVTLSVATNTKTVKVAVSDASDTTKGVVEIASSLSETGTVVPTAAQVSGGLATMVSGGSLHTALSGSGLANGVGSGNNTIYALINALHSVDRMSES